MVSFHLLKVGQLLGVNIVSHWQLEMVQENHIHVIKVRILQAIEIDIPFGYTPYQSALKQAQLNEVIL
jgi:hypothetical protein